MIYRISLNKNNRKGQFFIIAIILIVVSILGITTFLKNLNKDISINPVDKLAITQNLLRNLDSDIEVVLKFHNNSVSDITVFDLNLLADNYINILSYNGILSNMIFYINDTTFPPSIWEYTEVSYNNFYLHRRKQVYP